MAVLRWTLDSTRRRGSAGSIPVTALARPHVGDGPGRRRSSHAVHVHRHPMHSSRRRTMTIRLRDRDGAGHHARADRRGGDARRRPAPSHSRRCSRSTPRTGSNDRQPWPRDSDLRDDRKDHQHANSNAGSRPSSPKIPDARVGSGRSSAGAQRARHDLSSLGGDDPELLQKTANTMVDQMAKLRTITQPRVSGEPRSGPKSSSAALRPRRQSGRDDAGAVAARSASRRWVTSTRIGALLAGRSPDPDPRRARSGRADRAVDDSEPAGRDRRRADRCRSA